MKIKLSKKDVKFILDIVSSNLEDSYDYCYLDAKDYKENRKYQKELESLKEKLDEANSTR
jgi:hypothetical protein